MRALNRVIPALFRKYSPGAVLVSVGLQLEGLFRATLTAGQTTQREASAIIGRLERAVAVT